MLKSMPGREYSDDMSLTNTHPGEEMTNALTVGDVAAETDVAPSAVRFYEKHGVITAERTAGNQRRFDESAACRIHIAKFAQRVGLTVREIAELYADLPSDPEPADWRRIADLIIAEAQQRVTDLKSQLDALSSGVKMCDLNRHPLRP